MCRFTFYMGAPIRLDTLLLEPEHSLIRQSSYSLEREEPLNGDGFGVGWYARGHTTLPAVFRSITPAWNNRNLHNLARVVASDCVMAHVRAASRPSVSMMRTAIRFDTRNYCACITAILAVSGSCGGDCCTRSATKRLTMSMAVPTQSISLWCLSTLGLRSAINTSRVNDWLWRLNKPLLVSLISYAGMAIVRRAI
jgi:hypothetical protein